MTTIDTSGTAAALDASGIGRVDSRSGHELLDQFTTNDAGPLSTANAGVGVRTCEPGPGKLKLVNLTTAGAAFSIASNRLTWARSTAGSGYANYNFVAEGTFKRASGLAFYCKVNASIFAVSVGWSTAQGGNNSASGGMTLLAATVLTAGDTVTSITVGTSLTAGVDYKVWQVLRGCGGELYIVQGGVQYPSPTLVWVGAMDITENLFVQVSNNSAQYWTDDVEVAQLEDEIFTDCTAGMSEFVVMPTSGQTLSGLPADVWLTFCWRVVASEIVTQKFRVVDANNYSYIECDQAAGTIKLFEVVGGAAAVERDSGKTQTWTVGTAYRVLLRCFGTQVWTAVDKTVKHNYGSGINTSATGAEISWSGGVNGGAVNNWEAWPVVWAGTDLGTLGHV